MEEARSLAVPRALPFALRGFGDSNLHRIASKSAPVTIPIRSAGKVPMPQRRSYLQGLVRIRSGSGMEPSSVATVMARAKVDVRCKEEESGAIVISSAKV